MQVNGIFKLSTIDEFVNWLNQPFTREVKTLQCHHTYEPDYHDFTGDNHFALLNGMRDYHMNVMHYREIAQHLTTFPDGMIAICRPFNLEPAGIRGANTSSICIENLGNFDTGKDKMTDSHRETIIKLYASLCKKFKITPNTDTILYHHWYDLDTAKRTNGTGNTKTCPGTGFFSGNKVEDAKSNFIPEIQKLLGGN